MTVPRKRIPLANPSKRPDQADTHFAAVHYGSTEGTDRFLESENQCENDVRIGVREIVCTARHYSISQPLVSVIIPTYNRAWALSSAIQSIFSQTYRPIECLIVDDGSTDDTCHLVEQLSYECPRGIQLIYLRKANGGPNSARNYGLVKCHGDFICYLDSDDILLSNSVEERARALLNDSALDFCYGLSSIRDSNGNELTVHNEPWPGPGQPTISRYLFDTNSPLIRRSTCARVGMWRNDDLHGHEYEFFSRLKYCSERVLFINKVLSVYVRHSNACINDRSQFFWLSAFRGILSVKSLILHGPHDNLPERKQLFFQFTNVAKHLYRLGDYSNASAALLEAITVQPSARAFARWVVLRMMASIW